MWDKKKLGFVLFLLCIMLPATMTQRRSSLIYFSGISDKEKHICEDSKMIFADLRIFNPKCDSAQARMTAEALSAFEMSAQRDKMIAQLCTESSGKHTKNNKVLISSGGAMGISQITPTTAFHFMKYSLKAKDKKRLNDIGVVIPEWIATMKYSIDENGKRYLSKSNREKVKNFLADPRNNISLWTCMMSTLKDKYGMEKALIAYTDGEGSIKEKNPSVHPYVKRVKKNEKLLADHRNEHKRSKKNLSKKGNKA